MSKRKQQAQQKTRISKTDYKILKLASANVQTAVIASILNTDQRKISKRIGILQDARIAKWPSNSYFKMNVQFRDLLIEDEDPIPKSCLTSTVLCIACGMHQSGDYSALPILADALQDAGLDGGKHNIMLSFMRTYEPEPDEPLKPIPDVPPPAGPQPPYWFAVPSNQRIETLRNFEAWQARQNAETIYNTILRFHHARKLGHTRHSIWRAQASRILERLL